MSPSSSLLDACDAHRIVIPAPRGAAFVKQNKKNEFFSFLEGARAAGGKLLE
jgi:hypothetical protein